MSETIRVQGSNPSGSTAELIVQRGSGLDGSLEKDYYDGTQHEYNRYIIPNWQNSNFTRYSDFSELNRLYYFKLDGIDRPGLDQTAQNSLHLEGGYRTPGTLATVRHKDYLYLIFAPQSSSDENRLIESVAVVRENSDIVSIRARDSDASERACRGLLALDEVSTTEVTRPNFDQKFHNIFEDELVKGYIRLALQITDESDVLQTVQLFSRGEQDVRQSDRVSELLEDEKSIIYSGYVTVTRDRRFHFNWPDARISFQSQPDESTRLGVSDDIIRIWDLRLEPFASKIIHPGDSPIRVELYEGYFSSTWVGYLGLDEFISLALEFEIGLEAPLMIYHRDGGLSIQSLAEFSGSDLDEIDFIRANGEKLNLSWEFMDDGAMLGYIASIEETGQLAELYQSSTDVEFRREALSSLRDFVATRGEPRNE